MPRSKTLRPASSTVLALLLLVTLGAGRSFAQDTPTTEPQLAVRAASGGPTLQAPATATTVALPLEIANQGTERVTLQNLGVLLEPTEGVTPKVRLSEPGLQESLSSLTISAGASAPLILHVENLAGDAVIDGWLVFEVTEAENVEGRRHLRIRISRVQAARNVTLGAPRAEQTFLSNGRVEVVLRKPRTEEGPLPVPALTLWRQGDTDASRLIADGSRRVQWRPCSGGEWQDLEAVGVAGAEKTLPAAIRCADLAYQLGFLTSGKYSGTVEIQADDGTWSGKDFAFPMRDPWIAAFGVILLGVIGSFWLQRWARWGRLRDTRALGLARKRDELLSLKAEWGEGTSVWDRLLKRLTILGTNNRLFDDLDPAAFATSFDDLRQRALLWEQALATTRQINQRLDELEGDAEPKISLEDRQDVETECEELLADMKTALLQPEGRGIDPAVEGEAPWLLGQLRQLDDRLITLPLLKPAEDLVADLRTLLLDRQVPPAFETEVETARDEATTLLQDIETGGDKLHLRHRLQRAVRRYEALKSKIQKGGSVEPMSVPGTLTRRRSDEWTTRSEEGETRTPEEIGESILSNRALVSIVVAGVAALSGVATLWVTDPAFGSVGNYISAFLWGFGLDATTQTFLDFAARSRVLPPAE